ncbi:hypothetical protein [Erythrobacter sp.]|uniref:hypothetical protein n=1 Tax=Erythrobacter sp. TaxID=1042 RepID=UPI0025CEA9EA|nr:hypothetical protein [Erythrobacter sp.]
MANISRPSLSSLSASRQVLAREPSLRTRVRLRGAVIVLLIVAAAAGLAYFDGGEKPLRPIAEPVELSGAPR